MLTGKGMALHLPEGHAHHHHHMLHEDDARKRKLFGEDGAKVRLNEYPSIKCLCTAAFAVFLTRFFGRWAKSRVGMVQRGRGHFPWTITLRIQHHAAQATRSARHLPSQVKFMTA
jgi:hypothetical protein